MLVYFCVNYIAVGNLVLFADVLFNCYLCGAISIGRGDRS